MRKGPVTFEPQNWSREWETPIQFIFAFFYFYFCLFVLFCFSRNRVVSPASISHPGEPGDKSSSNPWPLTYQKWTTPRDKRLSYHLRSYFGMMTTPHDKEVTHRGVTLHSISTKGSEWVSEVEIECLTFKVSAVEWASLTRLRVPSQRNCCVNQSSYVLCSRYTYNVYCVMQIINFIWSSCS